MICSIAEIICFRDKKLTNENQINLVLSQQSIMLLWHQTNAVACLYFEKVVL